jgi:cytochrome c553
MRVTSWVLLLVCVSLGLSCEDPVHSAAVEALGPEPKGTGGKRGEDGEEDEEDEEGPTHRPGQPCLTCHGKAGPGEPELSLGGTVFADERGDAPKPGVRVRVTDHAGAQRVFTANSTGNFYVKKKEWDPIFPLKVQLELGEEVVPMNTRIGGSGSCGSCHRDARRGGPDSAHVPAVYWSRP